MGFFGGASSAEKRRHREAGDTAQQRFGDIYEGAMGGAGHWGERSRGQAAGQDERSTFLWNQLYGEGSPFAGGGGGGGGGSGIGGDVRDFWRQRMSGEYQPEEWGEARDIWREFAGGVGEDERSALRSRALSGTNMYDPSQDLRSRVQGGWGAGGASSDLERMKAVAALRNKAAWGAETDITDIDFRRKERGGTGLTDIGGRFEDLKQAGAGKIEGFGRADAAARRGAAARRMADERWRWGAGKSLMDTGYANVGLTGGDLPYYNAAGGAAQGGWGAGSQMFGQQQQNPGWGSQLVGMAGQAAGAFAGLPSFGGGGGGGGAAGPPPTPWGYG